MVKGKGRLKYFFEKLILKLNLKSYLCSPLTNGNAFVAQLDRASHYG